jgi:ferrous iron transport protein B
MLALYALGILAAAGTAFVFKRTLMRGPATTFILELPTYKIPQASQVARQVWTNSKEFVTKAGTTIFCLSVILWALMYYPRLPQAQVDQLVNSILVSRGADPKTITPQTPFTGDVKAVQDEVNTAVAAAQLRHSVAGRFGHLLEPAIKPLGYDWKMGVGLVGAFAAREVFVSTMGIVYSVGDIGDQTTPLADAMRADHYANGSPVWTPAVAVSLLVWFVLAMQCMSTLAIVRRETGGWRWPLFMMAYMNALAYVVAMLVYQVGSRLF